MATTAISSHINNLASLKIGLQPSDPAAAVHARRIGLGLGDGNRRFLDDAPLRNGIWYEVVDENGVKLFDENGFPVIRRWSGSKWVDGLFHVEQGTVYSTDVEDFADAVDAQLLKSYAEILESDSSSVTSTFNPETGKIDINVKDQMVNALTVQGFSVSDILNLAKRQASVFTRHQPISKHSDLNVEDAPTEIGYRFGASEDCGPFQQLELYTVVEEGPDRAFEFSGNWYVQDEQGSSKGDVVNVEFGNDRDQFQMLKFDDDTKKFGWYEVDPKYFSDRQRHTAYAFDALNDEAGEAPVRMIARLQGIGLDNFVTITVGEQMIEQALIPILAQIEELFNQINELRPLSGMTSPEWVPDLDGPLITATQNKVYKMLLINGVTGDIAGVVIYQTFDGGNTWVA